MNIEEQISAKVTISGTFLCHDEAGNVVQTIDISADLPVNEQEQDDGDQRSE